MTIYFLTAFFNFFLVMFSFILYADFFLVSIPSGQALSPTTPSVNTGLPPSIPQQNRSEQIPKLLRTNRPTVNSLMHLYGPWVLDACLLQTKDRYKRSSSIVNTNDCKHYSFLFFRLIKQILFQLLE
jgi:hypothetical protein